MNNQLRENNYILVPNFIDADRARQLAAEFRVFAREHNYKGDHQVPDSHSVYNYMPFLRLLTEKIDHSSELAETPLLPICSYSRVYRKGNVLRRHKDRPGCEVSLTVNLDGDADWPIWIQKPSGEEVAVELRPGDAIMYLGYAADHWRNEFTGNDYVQVFLHYVDSVGPYTNEHTEYRNYVARNPL